MRLSELSVSEARLVRASTVNRGLFDGSQRTDCQLKKWWFTFQRDAAQLNIPLRVVWGFRSYDEQAALFDAGRSKARAGRSPHNFGLALDIIHTQRAWRDMPQEGWELLNALGQDVARRQGLKLRWGGDWNGNGIPVPDDPAERFNDCAHWEFQNWRKMVGQPCEKLCFGGCLPALEMGMPYHEPPDASSVWSWSQRLKRFVARGPFA